MMTDLILDFIGQKQLAKASRHAYVTDLSQFLEIVSNRITEDTLVLYEQRLETYKVSARKRKRSAVNQFLYYLYEKGKLDKYYRLTATEKLVPPAVSGQLIDKAIFYQETSLKQGQLIALLILELGLSASEVQSLKQEAINTEFAILSLSKGGLKRVMELPTSLFPYLAYFSNDEAIYLFDNKGEMYSRQWFFNQLKLFLKTCHLEELSAKGLREQYILHQKSQGKSILAISKSLGLKSPATLEKFYS